MVLNVHVRLIRVGEKGGGGGGGEGGIEVGERETTYTYTVTYRYAVTTRMAPALRWAVMRAILMFH